MAKRLNDNSVLGLVGTASSEWIKEVNDGSKTHAVAVKNGITFFNGKSDSAGVTWDGVQELEVIIPTLADIVSNPVVLKGIANADADLPSNASNGDLYYIGTAGTYKGEVCEAGDMAICYNNTWHFIQGENQVSLASNALALGKTAQDAITVEGQTLTLAVDYDDVRSNTKVTKSATQTLDVVNGTVTVAPISLGLTQADGTSKTIGSDVTFSLPTALASGAVTITDKVLLPTDVTGGFSAGSFPTISKNAAAININATNNMSISKATETDGTTGDYITSVVAIKSAQLAAGSAGSGTAYVTGLTAASGKTFVSGIHVYDSQKDTAVDLTIPGAVSAEASTNTFAKGWGAEGASGDVVSSIAVGAVTGEFVTGLSGGGTSVLTGVTFGNAELDTTKNWFVTGLEDSASAVTAVSFGTVEVTPQTSAAVVSASVSDHVLSFTTGNFMTSATAALSGTGVTTKAFTKGGVKLSGFDSASDTFVSGSVNQATTTISYKSLTTGAVTLTQGAASEYAFDKAEEHAYDVSTAYLTISTTDATFTKNTPVLTNTTLTVTIPADTVAVDVTGGTLPSLTIASATGTISGTVGTALTSDSYTIKAVASDAASITIPGAYSLVSVAEGGVAVAAASTYNLANGTVTVPSGYVTDVFVDGTAVGVSTGA